MAARKTASKGSRPDKHMRDALAIELATMVGEKGEKVKKLRLVARKLIEVALEGDIAAIKEVNDRMDGKSAQGVQVTGEGGGPVQIEWKQDE